jgi:phosphodiesterase/alkaline phosphatase D-like protein
MKIARRDLLKLGAAQALLTTIPGKSAAAEPVQRPSLKTGPSILQGATDETKTQFSVVYDSNVNLGFYAETSSGNRILPDQTEILTMPPNNRNVTKTYFSGLSADEVYQLKVTNSANQKTIDSREFQTLRLDPDNVRFAICSCMDDKNHKPEIWQNLMNRQPQIIFFIGDSTYCDNGISGNPKPHQLWQRFCEARQTLEIYYSPRLAPIIATWDDHDFGKNDTNSESYPYVKESQKNFLSFFAQNEEYCDYLTRGPGVSSAFQANSHLFILMDDRSYRKNKGSKDRYAHWGEEQEKWMFNKVSSQRGPTWFFTGSQVFPQMVFKESVSGDHPVQFQGLLDGLKTVSSRVIFGSGDVHFSEISQIEAEALGYQTYELTSSSIHSTNIPGTPGIINNPRRIASTGSRNYIFVEASAAGSGCNFTATCCGSKGETLFEKKLAV